MDKYEYRVKTEQMLTYAEQKAYKKAMEIADTIDWRRVKNASMLCSVSEIYENTGEYQKSRDVLFVAYDRSPGSRKIVYRLGILALKLNDVNEATDCYEEFVQLAPKDPNQFILRYKILRAQRAPIHQQIEALVNFKKAEYVEKWAYELAKLYHEAGMAEECLEECDDLILWFSEGKYVYQAMELKMRYKPLTPAQQEKYRHRHENESKFNKIINIRPEVKKEVQPEEKAAVKPVMKAAVKPIAKPVAEVQTFEKAEAAEEIDEDITEEIVEDIAEEAVSETEWDIAEEPEDFEEEAEEASFDEYEEEEEDSLEEHEVFLKAADSRLAEYPEQKGVTEDTLVTSLLVSSVAAASKAAGIEDTPKQPGPISPKRSEFVSQKTGTMKIEEILQNWEAQQKEVAKTIERESEKRKQEKAARKVKQDTVQILSADIQRLLNELEGKETDEFDFGIDDDTMNVEDVVEDINELFEEPDEELEIKNKGDLIETLFVLDDEEEYEDSDEDFDDDDEDEVESDESYADEDDFPEEEYEVDEDFQEVEEDSESEEDYEEAYDEYDEELEEDEELDEAYEVEKDFLAEDEYEAEEDFEEEESYEAEEDFDDEDDFIENPTPMRDEDIVEEDDDYEDDEDFEEEDEYEVDEDSEEEDEYEVDEDFEEEDEYELDEDFEEEDEYEVDEDFEEEDEYELDEDFEEEDEYELDEDFEEEDEYEVDEDFEEDEYEVDEDFEEEDEYELDEDFEEEDEYEVDEDFEEEDEYEIDEDFEEEDEYEIDEDFEEEDEYEVDEDFEEEDEYGIDEDFEEEDEYEVDEDFEEEDEYEIDEDFEEEDPIEEIEEFEDTQSMIKRSPGGVVLDTGFVVQGRYDLEAQSEIGLKAGLTEEQKKLFSYFVPVRGMSEQIVEVLEADKRCKKRFGTSRTGNIVITGRKGSGKTVLAVDLVKAIQKARKIKQGKVAIVTGEALNKKEISDIIEKLHGGALIIEHAGKMNSRTVRELNELMEEQTGELLFVLEEQRRPLDKMMAANPGFNKKFTAKIDLPVFINDELVTFGQTYAKENGYRIDEMGILALYSKIDLMQKEDHAVTVAEVKEVMDEAIAHSQKANVKHLVKRVFGKSTDEADRIILKEDDFKL